MTKATSDYLNQPLRTEAQARADRLMKDARVENNQGNYVYAALLMNTALRLTKGDQA